MSAFYWPEPSFEFAAGVIDPGPTAESLYVVCHSGKVLMQFDEAQNWRAANSAETQGYSVIAEHYMGNLGSVPCYAMEVAAPGEGEGEFADLRSQLEKFSLLMFNLVGRALQISDWHRTHRFCGSCGQPTTDHQADRARVCEGCGLHFYPRLSPSIIVLVHRGDEVLLGRNHLFPEGLFSTLAGFVEPGESIEETVRREVKEEVGVNVGELSYRGSQPWPFPNSLMLGFHAAYESGDIVLQEEEIAEAKWFPCSDLPWVPGKFAISRWLIDDYVSSRGFDI